VPAPSWRFFWLAAFLPYGVSPPPKYKFIAAPSPFVPSPRVQLPTVCAFPFLEFSSSRFQAASCNFLLGAVSLSALRSGSCSPAVTQFMLLPRPVTAFSEGVESLGATPPVSTFFFFPPRLNTLLPLLLARGPGPSPIAED